MHALVLTAVAALLQSAAVHAATTLEATLSVVTTAATTDLAVSDWDDAAAPYIVDASQTGFKLRVKLAAVGAGVVIHARPTAWSAVTGLIVGTQYDYGYTVAAPVAVGTAGAFSSVSFDISFSSLAAGEYIISFNCTTLFTDASSMPHECAADTSTMHVHLGFKPTVVVTQATAPAALSSRILTGGVSTVSGAYDTEVTIYGTPGFGLELSECPAPPVPHPHATRARTNLALTPSLFLPLCNSSLPRRAHDCLLQGRGAGLTWSILRDRRHGRSLSPLWHRRPHPGDCCPPRKPPSCRRLRLLRRGGCGEAL